MTIDKNVELLEKIVRAQQECLIEALAAVLCDPIRPGSARDKAWQAAQNHLQAAHLIISELDADAEDAQR